MTETGSVADTSAPNVSVSASVRPAGAQPRNDAALSTTATKSDDANVPSNAKPMICQNRPKSHRGRSS